MNAPRKIVITDVLKGLENYLTELARFWNEYDPMPLTNSPAATESAFFSEPDLLNSAYSQANLLLEGSADHLMALIKTLTEPAECFAPWSCVRAILESCALASWLLDPALSPMERVKRSLALRYDGLTEEAKYGRLLDKQNTVDAVNAQIEKLEKKAVSLGLSLVRDKGKRTGIGMVMPSVTELTRDVLHSEADYRLMSAVVHAHSWATIKAGFRQVTYDGTSTTNPAPDQENYKGFEKHLDLTLVAYLCLEAINAFGKSVAFKCQVYGWDSKRHLVILNNALRPFGKQLPTNWERQ